MTLPDLDLLQTFLTVAEQRSISQAARTLGLTQPAVTKKIQRLEDGFGTSLIDRNARPLRLTQAGTQLFSKAPNLLQEAEALMHEVRAKDGQTLSVLRIGMPDSLSEIMGAEFIGSLKNHAKMIELKSGISPWLETSFRSRNFDLAVDNPPFATTENITLTPLFKDPFILVVPKAMAGLSNEDLIRTQNYVGYGRSSKFGGACMDNLLRLGVEDPARFYFDSTQSLLRFVQASYGWAITTTFCLMQSPLAIKDMDVRPCPNSVPRSFFLLNRNGETDEIAHIAAQKFLSVFEKLVAGPWEKLSPISAQLLREENGL